VIATVTIPERVAGHWLEGSHASFGIHGPAVADDASARLTDAVARWGLTDLDSLGESYWGAAFTARAGETDVVLKINPRTPTPAGGWVSEHAAEPQALAFWRARCDLAPAIRGWAHMDSAYLMERCQPGTPLRDTGMDALEVTWTLGRLCGTLHRSCQKGDWVRVAAPRLNRSQEAQRWRDALAGTPEGALLDSLLTASGPATLLHLDLHGTNVLAHHDQWRVIDPLPAIGDPHADIYALIFHPAFLSGIPHRPQAARLYVGTHLAAYCEAAGLGVERAAAWLRCRAAYRIWRADRENDQQDASWTDLLPRMVAALPEHPDLLHAETWVERMAA